MSAFNSHKNNAIRDIQRLSPTTGRGCACLLRSSRPALRCGWCVGAVDPPKFHNLVADIEQVLTIPSVPNPPTAPCPPPTEPLTTRITVKMAAFVKAINAKIRSNPVSDYICSTRTSL